MEKVRTTVLSQKWKTTHVPFICTSSLDNDYRYGKEVEKHRKNTGKEGKRQQATDLYKHQPHNHVSECKCDTRNTLDRIEPFVPDASIIVM